MDNAEERSLDLVQRLIISALIAVVFGAPTVALAGYAAFGDQVRPSTAIGLCVLSGVMGLLTVGAIHVINRRQWYFPTLVIGLVPAALAAYRVFFAGT